MSWERFAGGFERNTKTGEFRATEKYGKFGKVHKEMSWERFAGGFERNTKTGEFRATEKYGKFGKVHKENLKRRIKEIIKHYHYPISDIKGLNKLLKKELGVTVKKETVKKLLGY